MGFTEFESGAGRKPMKKQPSSFFLFSFFREVRVFILPGSRGTIKELPLTLHGYLVDAGKLESQAWQPPEFRVRNALKDASARAAWDTLFNAAGGVRV